MTLRLASTCGSADSTTLVLLAVAYLTKSLGGVSKEVGANADRERGKTSKSARRKAKDCYFPLVSLPCVVPSYMSSMP